MIGVRLLALAAAAAFIASLLLPAIAGSGFPTLDGMDVLRQGASGWRNGVVAWYANPLFVAAIVLTGLMRYRAAVTVASVGLLLAFSSFSAEMMAAITGRNVPPFGFQIGFYCWLLAFFLLTAACVWGIYKESRSPDSA